MSSSNRANARRAVALTAILGASLLLGGCVQPLYMSSAVGGGAVGDELQAIKVEPIPDRLGHYLTNELISQLNGSGSNVPPKYRLVVTLNERVSTPTINTFTGQAEAGAITVDASYQLFPVAGGTDKPMASGSVSQFVAYDRTSQRLSNVRAARDAEIRNARTIAEQIRTRVAIALTK
ncbi:LPS-assembly lipoprotein [Rhodoblastus acidophilus]|uniref:LPS assembly lipoprotein LptE n=1 Tax=Rhodoblastus acidophilus TaxID=1074 RepID=UPI0022243407|nr:LPS assembly lipoprotein LptE [Rhodoblastus acidophilus]MCW2315834.1 LPS-assembly lipoprotein [Rhodoblastus acidophilus]